MPVTAIALGSFVQLRTPDKAGATVSTLTPAEALDLTAQLAEAMQVAIVAGATPPSEAQIQSTRLIIGPSSFETLGRADGKAAIVLSPENWLRLEIELNPTDARAMAQSLISAAEFMEGGSKTH